MVRVTNSLLTVRGRLTFPATLARVIAGRTNWFLEMPDTASAMPMWLYTLIPTYLHGSNSPFRRYSMEVKFRICASSKCDHGIARALCII